MQKRSVIGVWAIISAMTIGFGGCLELTTAEPSESSSSSSGSSGDITSSSSTSSSSSATSSGAMTSSSSSASSSSSSTSSSSSSSSASSSSGVAAVIVTKSNLGTTLLNDNNGVTCGLGTQTLPSGQMGDALECTQTTETTGYFRQGIKATLKQGKNYTFSFFFKNSNFAMPFDQPYTKIGVAYKVDITVDGNSLVTTDAYPNGWYRQKISFSPGSFADFDLFFHQNLSQTSGGAYWLYGFQVEEGFTATDYVP